MVEPHEQITISEYQLSANSFREGTWNHDVSQNRDALVAAMPKNPGKILDLGCGPGRDLVAFKELGHDVVGLDATPAFVEMARTASGCEVWQQCFESLDLPPETFDGVFANASLIHVPRSAALAVLKNLWGTLVPGGAMVMSVARGEGEGYTQRPTGNRYITLWEYETLAPMVEGAGFQILDRYYRPPGLPRQEQSWLAIVSQKIVGTNP